MFPAPHWNFPETFWSLLFRRPAQPSLENDFVTLKVAESVDMVMISSDICQWKSVDGFEESFKVHIANPMNKRSSGCIFHQYFWLLRLLITFCDFQTSPPKMFRMLLLNIALNAPQNVLAEQVANPNAILQLSSWIRKQEPSFRKVGTRPFLLGECQYPSLYLSLQKPSTKQD